jgi:hypothetical protein
VRGVCTAAVMRSSSSSSCSRKGKRPHAPVKALCCGLCCPKGNEHACRGRNTQSAVMLCSCHCGLNAVMAMLCLQELAVCVAEGGPR